MCRTEHHTYESMSSCTCPKSSNQLHALHATLEKNRRGSIPSLLEVGLQDDFGENHSEATQW